MTDARVALVTGGGRGLGRAIALRLGSRGYRIGLLGRSEDSLRVVGEELAKLGTSCSWRRCDAGQWAEVERAIPELVADLGGVSVLVNNAGGWLPSKLSDCSPSEFRDLLQGSVLAAAYCSKAVLPFMRASRNGFILNIGSTSGLDSTRDNAVSSTPKGAIRTFSRSLGLEVETFGIRVGVLHPSSVEKKLPFDEVPPPNADGHYVRIGQAQVADIAVFMIEQSPNLTIRELVVTPSGAFR